jgi:uncharacterized protein
MGLTQSALIEVKRIKGKGRGVFAQRSISEGTVIERVPVIVFPIAEIWSEVAEPLLVDYVFMWGKDTVALALGYGSLYNHSYQPNARYDDVGLQTKEFTAIRDIEPGEEITINYNGEPQDRTSVGFKVVG